MEKKHYEEMLLNLNACIANNVFQNKKIYLFGHCNATEELADLLLNRGYSVEAILDNNAEKYGKRYGNIIIEAPMRILTETQKSVVCIAARAYEAMAKQLKSLGYTGQIYKMIEYNSFAEYSLSDDTIVRKRRRLKLGMIKLAALKEKHKADFYFLCPFAALGDICFMMSYLPYFAKQKGISNCFIGVIGEACAQTVGLFGEYETESFSQQDMDEMIQAVVYTKDKDSFIPHQDRPYVIDLHKALYIKKIPLEQIYCCGVFGLPKETKPYRPTHWKPYRDLDKIQKGRSVILSPYAKSVTTLSSRVWQQIVKDYTERGFQCYTNVVRDEKPLEGTLPVSPELAEIQPLAEYAGTFIGIRSGLCDVLRYADCTKIALYPDYNYCDTKWKAIDMYALKGWENLVVKEDFVWKRP